VRVAILGNSGSGKSTLARAIAAAASIPILDLDTVAWESDQPAALRDEMHARSDVQAFCQSNEGWIVEGCYANLMEEALSYRPKLILLNPGQAACLTNCRSRPWEPHKYASREEQDANLEFLLSWVAEYYTRGGHLSLAAHRKCFTVYNGPKQELTAVPDTRSLAMILNPDPVKT
jgi:adenylate kinase family enzyme